MGFLNRRQQMGWAALIVAISIFLSRFMGLIRDKVISYLFGATNESDIYFAAFVIPDFINYLLAGGYFSITLIPFLADFMERDREDGWRFFSTVLTWIGIAIVTITGVAMWFAPELARIAAPGLPPEAMERLTRFLRIILPAQVFFLTGACFTAVLYLRKQFFAPALTPILYNLFIILGGIVLRSRGMEGFCWGVLAGALIGNLLVPLFAACQGEGVRLRASFNHPGLKRYILLALPLMLGQSIAMLDEQLLRVFGSLAGIGAVSWLAYARRIMMVPVSVVGQAAGVASYPFIAELAAKKEFTRFYEVMNSALKNVLTLLVPMSVWMAVVSEPTVRLIFQQGHFSLADTERTALLLQILLTAVCFWGFQQVLGRAFYALQDTLSPAVLGTGATICCIPLFLFLTHHMDAPGVAIASASSIALYTIALSLWWMRRHGRAVFSGLLLDVLKLLVLSAAASVPSWLILRIPFLDGGAHPILSAFLSISASGLCFVAAFAPLASYFAPALMRPFLKKAGPVGALLIR